MDPTTTVLYPTNTAKIAPFTRALIGISLAYIFASSLALFKIYYTQKHRKSVIPYLEDFLLLIGVVCLAYIPKLGILGQLYQLYDHRFQPLVRLSIHGSVIFSMTSGQI